LQFGIRLLEPRLCTALLRSYSSAAAAPPIPEKGEEAKSQSSGAATASGEAPKAEEPRLTLDERVLKLEAAAKVQEAKLEEVEKLAKRKGMMMTMVMEYGASFALWYGTVWASMWLGLYGLLEMEVVSWQESLRPLFSSMGLEGHADKIDPSMGNAVLAFLVNECLEPLRFPLVIATGAPVIRAFRKLRAGGKQGEAAAGAAGGGGAAS